MTYLLGSDALATALARPSFRAACPERLNCVELVEGERSAAQWSREISPPRKREIPRFRCAPLGMTGLSSNLHS